MSITTPYTFEEKELLIQIIKGHPIIENKRTDASSINKKRESWNTVCEEFNSTSPALVKVVSILFVNSYLPDRKMFFRELYYS